MWVGVLGPTLVQPEAGQAPVALTAAKHRALLAALALQPGRPVSADALVDALWGPDAPPSAQGSLHSYLSVVRRALEPDLTARAPSRYLVSSDLGYELRVAPADVDAIAFAATVEEVHGEVVLLVGGAVPVTNDVQRATALVARLDATLALWRGDPYADVVGTEQVEAERARLGELRALAEEDRVTLRVAVGDDGVVGDLEGLLARYPLRERLWMLQATALARAGRQADALSALEKLRTVLDEELGLEPSAAVRELQTAILRQNVMAPRTPRPARDERPAPQLPEIDLTAPPWPMTGRDDELAVLAALLAEAERGAPAFAALVGEPGAGKSRLALELARHARERGVQVLAGRCSQDEDAPPFWPWTVALGEHLADLTHGPADDPHADLDARRFAVAETIRNDLVTLARKAPVLLVLEDLHWADASSLRVLRHLCAHAGSARLLVLCTWRRGEPAEALADAAEALARRHATHLDLDGLSADEAQRLLAAVAGNELDRAVSRTLHDRTEGNPFFLVEYARLARDEGGDLTSAFDAVVDSMPRTVADVLQRRIRSLPEDSAAALTAGSVIGREFDVGLLARALDASELVVLDLLEPALEADLVHDLGGDRFRFGHALVRDSAYAELSRSRRERMHAAVAGLLAEAAADRAPEVARHWAAAGDRFVHRAWRAAAHAGRVAMTAYAAEEAREHYATALDLLARDPAGSLAQRCDLLVGYADACRWSTRLLEAANAIDEAIGIADQLGDPAMVVGAATVSADGAVWPVRDFGMVNEEVVAAMRRALEQLPRDDSEVRCRLLLLLAGELFYGGHPEEIDALAEDSLAMARRLGDRRLLISVLTYSFSVRWRRATIDDREAMAREAIELSRAAEDARSELLSRFLLAAVLFGRGRIEGLEAEVETIAVGARERQMYFLELATITQSQSWAAMRGDTGAIARHMVRLFELDELISLSQKADALQGAILVPQMWGADPLPAEAFLPYLSEAKVPISAAFTTMLFRQGQPELAREVWSNDTYEPGEDSWYSELHWAFGAECALELGLPELGADLYARLLPLRGQAIISGTGPAHGPADAYLACAAAAAGELGQAGEHADDAQRRCEEWNVPQVARWLGDLRKRHNF